MTEKRHKSFQIAHMDNLESYLFMNEVHCDELGSENYAIPQFQSHQTSQISC